MRTHSDSSLSKHIYGSNAATLALALALSASACAVSTDEATFATEEESDESATTSEALLDPTAETALGSGDLSLPMEARCVREGVCWCVGKKDCQDLDKAKLCKSDKTVCSTDAGKYSCVCIKSK